jgi:hypothetical protein
MVCYVESVVRNQCVLYWASGCDGNHCVPRWRSGSETSCVMLSQWIWILLYYAEPMTANYRVLCCASGCETLFDMRNILCSAEPVPVNYRVLVWTSDYEWWCVMQSKLLWITVRYDEPFVVNHYSLCLDSGCESWEWSWTIVSYTEAVVVNHVVFCWTIDCDSLWVLCQWLWNMVSYAEPVCWNHGVLFCTICRESYVCCRLKLIIGTIH